MHQIIKVYTGVSFLKRSGKQLLKHRLFPDSPAVSICILWDNYLRGDKLMRSETIFTARYSETDPKKKWELSIIQLSVWFDQDEASEKCGISYNPLSKGYFTSIVK